MAPLDHFEIGSTLRSAAAFGWKRVFLQDAARAWFGSDRARTSEARAAARRSRNPLTVIPVGQDAQLGFEEVCVVASRSSGGPLLRTALARGSRQLIVVPDEDAVDLSSENWGRLGKHVTFAHVEAVHTDWRYQLRLVAGIALAESARQLGRVPREPSSRPARTRLVYDSLIRLLEPKGEQVDPAELAEY